MARASGIHCTLRPNSTTNGLAGAAMRSGSVPAKRSQVVDWTTKITVVAHSITALPTTR